MLRRQRAIEIVPSSKALRWRRYDVPQHLAPETSDALRFCAVEGDLDLLDRRHRYTIETHIGRVPAGADTLRSSRRWTATRAGDVGLMGEAVGQPLQSQWVAVVDAAVFGVEEFELDHLGRHTD